MKRAVITGATGAIGIALINELISNGTEVLVLCRKNSKRNNNIPRHRLVEIQFCALDGLADYINNTGKSYEVFFHFAWDGTTGEARNDMYLQNLNVKYALDAVGAAHRLGCHTFIGAGSQAEYGLSSEDLTAETAVFPVMGYGYAKLCAGLMTRTYAEQLGMKHIWTRILSVYGPNDGANSLISSVIDSLKRGIVPKCTMGEQVWDYLYSGDAAKAFLAISERGKDKNVYVIGSGNKRSLADYIRDIRDIVAPDSYIDFGAIPYGKNQVMRLCANIDKLHKDTGWKPTTAFKEGIRSII